MTFKSRRGFSVIALISGIGMAGFSTTSYACSVEPYIGSVCVMAVSPTRFPGIGSSYLLAMGQTMQINQATALYSLVGTTFGGNGSSNFNLPDLRGRVIIGYDPRNAASGAVGANGGSTAIKLTVAQLPVHSMSFNAPVNLSGLTAQTTLAGLSATANLSGLVITGPASGLTVRASSGSGGVTTPTNNYLGKPTSATAGSYTANAPDVSLNAGTISGTLSLTVGQGVTAPVGVTGNASTTLTGAATVTGTTAPIGGNADIPTMPPYLVMPYYIAVNGIYPSSND
jgi:microcystin-dependent protein